MKRTLILLFLIVLFKSVFCVELTISQPGLYALGDNLQSNPTGADTIVNITTSNVVLDLSDRIISQGNAIANVNGITVNSGLTDIAIKNGTIRGVTGEGIIVNQTCSRIYITNITFESCATDGILLNGGGGANQIADVQISGCRFYACANSITPGNVITIGQANKISIDDCIISVTTAVAGVSGISLVGCNLSNFSNIVIQGNSSTSTFSGIFSITSTGNSFSNILIKNNAGATGFSGFLFSSSNNHVLTNVIVLGNTSSGASVTGFDLTSSLNIVSNGCKALANSSVSFATGFRLGASNSNVFNDCIGSYNTTTGAVFRAEGFRLEDSNFVTLNRCVAANNIATNNIGVGAILTGVGAGSSNCTISNCLFHRNNGNNAANSFGVLRNLGNNNLFIRSIGFNNNITAANQFSGVPVGSVVTPAAPQTNNLNTAGNYWNNVSVAT